MTESTPPSSGSSKTKTKTKSVETSPGNPINEAGGDGIGGVAKNVVDSVDNVDATSAGGAVDMQAVENLLPVDEHIEEVSESGRRVRRRGVYLLPNLITTGALFGGFYAIIAAMDKQFEAAAFAIFVAQCLDGLDGRVARYTNTSSAFGVEYDSLSDMVSFGLAPAMVMFHWALAPLDKLGWAAGFALTACAALRLARFNAQASEVDKRYFVGLPSPPAATLIASLVWMGHDLVVSPLLSYCMVGVTFAVAMLMVSNVRYTSFKGLGADGRTPFVLFLIVVAVFVVIAINPAPMLVMFAGTYTLSGPLMALGRLLWKKPEDQSSEI